MNHLTLSILAFLGGVFLALQGSFNAQLGVLLKNPLMASAVAFFCSTVFSMAFLLVTLRNIPVKSQMVEIPVYLWFIGGLFSVVGITLYYITIPKLGVATMISLGLSGQLIFAIIAGHFGWFNFPVEPISIQRLIGIAAMISGILLINLK